MSLRPPEPPAGRWRPARALTIAGSDSGGGAGIQADLKVFLAHGVHGMSAVTAVTAQNSLGVQAVHPLPPEAVEEQLRSVIEDIGVDAAKTGMLATAEIVRTVAATVRELGVANLVVDPVAASKHGDALLRPDAVQVLRTDLLPLAVLVTPNLGEVDVLTGVRVVEPADLDRAAGALLRLGPRWVLVKGGHLAGPDAVDLLTDGTSRLELRTPRLATLHTHGTGCTLAAAITANLALGLELPAAVQTAKRFVTGAIAGGYPLGAGVGPTDPAWRLRAAGLFRPGGPSHPTPSGWPFAASPFEG